MPGSTPTHGAVFVQTLARDLLQQGYTQNDVFGGTGLTSDLIGRERPFVPFDRIAQFFEHAARLTGNDALGFERGAVREMRRSGLICYVGLSAPTVLDFIKNIARYRRVFSDAVEVNADRLETDGLLEWYFSVSSNVERRQYVEFGASGLLHAMRQASGERFCPRLVTFRHSRNTNIEKFEQFFGCEVKFRQDQNAYFFRRRDLGLTLSTADDDLYGVLMDHCEAVLRDKSRNLPPVVIDVERAISSRLTSGEANQKTIARELGMSARTLARRLADEETTFFKVLDSLRKALASGYLRDSDLSLAEISFLLGYSSLSSFNDAFRRWTGKTPGQFRAS